MTFFNGLGAVQGCTAIFDDCKSWKMKEPENAIFQHPAKSDRLLARISLRPSTAAAQWHALTGVRSVANASHAAPLNHLATNAGEKSGLVPADGV